MQRIAWILSLLLHRIAAPHSLRPCLGFVETKLTTSVPSCRLGSRSPPNSSQHPTFFSKLTESTSAIVKSKKQEMSKKMMVTGNDNKFSESGLSLEMKKSFTRKNKTILRFFWLCFQMLASQEQKSSICQHPPLQVIKLFLKYVSNSFALMKNLCNKIIKLLRTRTAWTCLKMGQICGQQRHAW